MTYGAVVKGTFRARPNRFIAQVDTEEGTQICHVKNTGRCKELLVPGATVYLAEGKNPARKTKYDLVAVEKGSLLINMDSQAPNQVAQEYLPRLLPGLTAWRRAAPPGCVIRWGGIPVLTSTPRPPGSGGLWR